MRCAEGVIVVALCSVELPLRARAQIAWPKESDGYSIVKTNDVFHAAPPGYEGKITSTTMVATGNTPATKGKSYTVTLNLSTEVDLARQGTNK
jgi:hypothetical protein